MDSIILETAPNGALTVTVDGERLDLQPSTAALLLRAVRTLVVLAAGRYDVATGDDTDSA